MTIKTGMFRGVKKLIYILMLTWLTLMSTGAAAHSVHGGAHNAEHAHHGSSKEKQSETRGHSTAESAEASHADTCNHSHCGHGHNTGVLTQYSSYADSDTARTLVAVRTSAKSSHIAHNIEWPKWRATTPPVVSLLS